jgi:hypothetical protein
MTNWSKPPTLQEIIEEIEDEQQQLSKKSMRRVRRRMAKVLGEDPVEYLEKAKKKDFHNARRMLMDVIVVKFASAVRPKHQN